MTIRGDGVEEQRLSKTGEIRRMAKDDRFKVLGVVSRASVRKDKNGKTGRYQGEQEGRKRSHPYGGGIYTGCRWWGR